MRHPAVWLLTCALLAVAATARAQDAGVDRAASPARWEAAVGFAWFRGMSLGDSTATLEQPNGQPFTLFKTETSMGGGPGVALTLGRYATPRLFIETAFAYARPDVSTKVTADAEEAPSVTSTIGLHQYVVEGSARWHLARSWGRFSPYLRAGAGYLRQLDADHDHVEAGVLLHAGGGVDRVMKSRPGARIDSMGLRLEARLTGRTGGFDVEDRTRLGGAAAALLFLTF